MDCLQLPFIREEEAFSWTQRFLTRKFGPKMKVCLWQTNLKANVCRNSTFEVNRQKNATGRRRLTLSNRAAMRRTTQQTLLAINLASQQKTTNLYFSSQVRKQFKVLTVPFKPLHCCLRSDKLVNCQVWKICKDLFSNVHGIWSVNKIVLFNGFLSDSVEITLFVYTKIIILWNRGEESLNIYRAVRGEVNIPKATIHLDFKE